MSDAEATLNLHASCVSFESKGVLIIGPSGVGKSGLALQLMALGAALVSDDRTDLWVADAQLLASSPDQIRGLIEARGVGILRAEPCAIAKIKLVIDMESVETERLPPARWVTICGMQKPCLHKVDRTYFPAAILQYLKFGKMEPS
ncbi:MAG: HPr kinase/phosphatase C-terminal domain-containing protein [Roseobacter sp.]